MSAPPRAFWKRLGVALAATIVFVPTLVTLRRAEAYARAHTELPCSGLFNTPTDMGLAYEEITLTARDRVEVPGWYVPSQNGAAIIAAPGLNGNRSHALADFGFLGNSGYGLLVFDQRHCANPVIPQTLGYNERLEILAGVDYLSSQRGVTKTGAVGMSAGGVSALLAAAEEPAIEAIVEVGGYHNLEADMMDAQDQHGWYDTLTRRLIVGAFNRQTGVHPRDASPVDAIVHISPRPVLLIYGEHEALSGQLLFEAAGEPKELWLVDGAGHAQYRTVAPEEYERRIRDFFDTHLLQDGFPT